MNVLSRDPVEQRFPNFPLSRALLTSPPPFLSTRENAYVMEKVMAPQRLVFIYFLYILYIFM